MNRTCKIHYTNKHEQNKHESCILLLKNNFVRMKKTFFYLGATIVVIASIFSFNFNSLKRNPSGNLTLMALAVSNQAYENIQNQGSDFLDDIGDFFASIGYEAYHVSDALDLNGTITYYSDGSSDPCDGSFAICDTGIGFADLIVKGLTGLGIYLPVW
jgi:hypothetical protein